MQITEVGGREGMGLGLLCFRKGIESLVFSCNFKKQQIPNELFGCTFILKYLVHEH